MKKEVSLEGFSKVMDVLPTALKVATNELRAVWPDRKSLRLWDITGVKRTTVTGDDLKKFVDGFGEEMIETTEFEFNAWNLKVIVVRGENGIMCEIFHHREVRVKCMSRESFHSWNEKTLTEEEVNSIADLSPTQIFKG